MTADQLDVEISIVNTNNRELLRTCLASLPDACEGLDWHATVVDNASDDGSVEMVRTSFPGISLLHNQSRLGFSANHNQVMLPLIEQQISRYVLILNEDTELDPGSVNALVAFCDGHRRIGAVGPWLRGLEGKSQRSFFPFPTVMEQFLWSLRPGRPERPNGGVGWLNGSCILLRTEALRQIGSLDERFFIFFEDTDLCKRLWLAGWECAICEESTAVHLQHRTVSRPAFNTAMDRQMRRSQYLYFRKHHGRVRAALMSGLIHVALAARAVKALGAGILLRNPNEWRAGIALLSMARYRPSTVLTHEIEARGAEPDGFPQMGLRQESRV